MNSTKIMSREINWMGMHSTFLSWWQKCVDVGENIFIIPCHKVLRAILVIFIVMHWISLIAVSQGNHPDVIVHNCYKVVCQSMLLLIRVIYWLFIRSSQTFTEANFQQFKMAARKNTQRSLEEGNKLAYHWVFSFFKHRRAQVPKPVWTWRTEPSSLPLELPVYYLHDRNLLTWMSWLVT